MLLAPDLTVLRTPARPGDEAVTVYAVTALPPSLAGPPHSTVAVPGFVVAFTPVGALGALGV